jgi:hypothetical protein
MATLIKRTSQPDGPPAASSFMEFTHARRTSTVIGSGWTNPRDSGNGTRSGGHCSVSSSCRTHGSEGLLGAGSPGGTEPIISMLRNRLGAPDSNWACIQLDLSNAFNAISWYAVASAIQRLNPALCRFMK